MLGINFGVNSRSASFEDLNKQAELTTKKLLEKEEKKPRCFAGDQFLKYFLDLKKISYTNESYYTCRLSQESASSIVSTINNLTRSTLCNAYKNHSFFQEFFDTYRVWIPKIEVQTIYNAWNRSNQESKNHEYIEKSPSEELTKSECEPESSLIPSKLASNINFIASSPVLTNEEILKHNSRKVNVSSFSQKIINEFVSAQRHLLTGYNKNWNYSLNSQDKISILSYDSKKIKNVVPDDIALLKNVGIAYTQGRRESMEDTSLATILKFTWNEKVIKIPLFGIFDGHGGKGCSTYLKANLPEYLQKRLAGLDHNSEEIELEIFNILKCAFVELGRRYRENESLKFKETLSLGNKLAGATATIAFILNDHIWVANVGDSRAILSVGGEAMALSEDAKLVMNKYARGVDKRNGTIVCFDETLRVVDCGINIARAVGHDELSSGINPRSKIIKFALDKLPKNVPIFLALASDGLWEEGCSKQIAQTLFNNASKTCEEKAQHLVQAAYACGSEDNISVIVADLSTK